MSTTHQLHKYIPLLVVGATLGACADDVSDSPRNKGVIDEAALSAGATVVLRGQTGQVSVPFTVPVPEADGDTGGDSMEDALAGSVTLVVSSDDSGASADLASGAIVGGVPAAAGQWAWSLNGARDEAAVVFFNQAVSGLTLQPTVNYSASLSVTSNDYVENVATFVFPIAVVDG